MRFLGLVGGLLLLSVCACASAQREDGQIWRPASGDSAERIPGPMKDFGPYEDFSSAIQAACPLILSNLGAVNWSHEGTFSIDRAQRPAR